MVNHYPRRFCPSLVVSPVGPRLSPFVPVRRCPRSRWLSPFIPVRRRSKLVGWIKI